MARRAISKQMRQQIYEKYNGRCAYCGQPILIKDMQVDHIVPVYKDGEDNMQNYNPACRMCNFYKSTYGVEQFRSRLGKLLGRLEKRQFIYRLARAYGLVEEHDSPIQFYFEKHSCKSLHESAFTETQHI